MAKMSLNAGRSSQGNLWESAILWIMIAINKPLFCLKKNFFLHCLDSIFLLHQFVINRGNATYSFIELYYRSSFSVMKLWNSKVINTITLEFRYWNGGFFFFLLGWMGLISLTDSCTWTFYYCIWRGHVNSQSVIILMSSMIF